MTATRDRRSDLDNDPVHPSWGERPALGSRAVPWWGAVLLAFVLTLAGTVIDLKTSGSLNWVFKVAYVLGCVLAVTLVKRRSLFGPMVQPPLIMAVVAAPTLALFTGGSSGGLMGKAIAVGPPLIGNFPVMAVATVLTLVIGGIRMVLQRKPALDSEEDSAEERPRPRRPEPAAKGTSTRQPAARPRPNAQPPARERERPPGPARDRAERPERADRPDRGDRPPPPRGGAGGRGVPPGGRPAPGAGGPVRGAGGQGRPAPGRGRPAAGGRPPQPPPRRPRRPEDDEY
ncbi:hypothetical protein BC739_007171 [Kutzneria viridogrisea]|uniref:DUF6542 domain-containing protein n=1 Tax=Kutzneria viridogrisea TaxID=47990 RepID=A0ABR6BSN8_9PSEU|nr:hypothetical protein [Kutzneria viridogrisea]